jgi:hypothetical protein
MRRSALALSALLAVVALALGAGPLPLTAQPGTPPTTARFVGTWLGHDVEDRSAPPFQLSLLADGVCLQVDPSAGDHAGVWRPTGPRTFQLTIQQATDPGLATNRGAGEVAADGQSFTVAYTIEFAPVGGTSTGQYGPGHITGTRLAVEPMGTPVGPLSVLKGQLAKPTPGT